ncbi:MAG: hypothetical protein E5Y88_17770 [Mesorhizobium sp.]|nr:MAG: hypothetical protein EOS20_09425 [Mesorhizobium sp.]TIL24538.1 MAG: hypothetical protein E5Y88_17770 [Mesorhizobium sp.]
MSVKLPPSVLPDISPSRGEITPSSTPIFNLPRRRTEREASDSQSPPLRGRCQVLTKRAGQRGVLLASAGA